MSEIDPFRRSHVAMKIRGGGKTGFYKAINTGEFPPPDTFIGPRTPVWLDSTLRSWQQKKLAEPKPAPIQTPRRRRYKRA
jgi:predicted DNA-binding transcriptional regulator AlpA